MQFPVARDVREESDSIAFQAELDELLAAVLTRRDLEARSAQSTRRPSLEEWPTVGEGFTWNSAEQSDGAKRGGSHALGLVLLALLVVAVSAATYILF
jgi:hypothetical protein